MKTYDCFAFFNELDLLELRLEELDPVVDQFVLVEATRTFQAQPKELIFQKNRDRFHKFLPKIKHIVVDHYPLFGQNFDRSKPGTMTIIKKNKSDKDSKLRNPKI